MTDLVKCERGKGVYILSIPRYKCWGFNEYQHLLTFYLPSLKAVRLVISEYMAQYGYSERDFILRYFNTGLIVSKDCEAPHFNIIDVDVADAMH